MSFFFLLRPSIINEKGKKDLHNSSIKPFFFSLKLPFSRTHNEFPQAIIITSWPVSVVRSLNLNRIFYHCGNERLSPAPHCLLRLVTWSAVIRRWAGECSVYGFKFFPEDVIMAVSLFWLYLFTHLFVYSLLLLLLLILLI